MKPRIRWGVIGSGGIAWRRTIPEGLVRARNAELVAVWGRNARTNAAVAAQFNVRAARTLHELLALDLDAVYVASPNHAHLEQVTRAAQARKHVFCEKPLGTSVAEARRIVAVCRQAGVQLGTAFMMRFQAQHQAARALIRAGKLGQPVFARAQLSCWYPPIAGAWRQSPKLGGGGALMDLAGHCLDLLEFFFGPIASVSCLLGRKVHAYPVEDGAVVMVRFFNGALATVDTFFSVPDAASRNRLELYGSRGCILAEGTIGQEARGKMTAHFAPPQKYAAQQGRQRRSGLTIAPRAGNTYRAEIEWFGEMLRRGEATTESALAGLRSQLLLAAAYRAAATGRTVRLPNC